MTFGDLPGRVLLPTISPVAVVLLVRIDDPNRLFCMALTKNQCHRLEGKHCVHNQTETGLSEVTEAHVRAIIDTLDSLRGKEIGP